MTSNTSNVGRSSEFESKLLNSIPAVSSAASRSDGDSNSFTLSVPSAEGMVDFDVRDCPSSMLVGGVKKLIYVKLTPSQKEEAMARRLAGLDGTDQSRTRYRRRGNETIDVATGDPSPHQLDRTEGDDKLTYAGGDVTLQHVFQLAKIKEQEAKAAQEVDPTPASQRPNTVDTLNKSMVTKQNELAKAITSYKEIQDLAEQMIKGAAPLPTLDLPGDSPLKLEVSASVARPGWTPQGNIPREHWDPRGDGLHFVLFIKPNMPQEVIIQNGGDFIFNIDTSGSMSADSKMQKAIDAIAECLQASSPRDRFAIGQFNTEYSLVAPLQQTASPEQVAQLVAKARNLRANGVTNVKKSLHVCAAASRLLTERDPNPRARQAVVETDGMSSDGLVDAIFTTNALSIAARNFKIHTFGVGIGPSATFGMKSLADQSGGKYSSSRASDAITFKRAKEEMNCEVFELSPESSITVENAFPDDAWAGDSSIKVTTHKEGSFTLTGFSTPPCLNGKQVGISFSIKIRDKTKPILIRYNLVGKDLIQNKKVVHPQSRTVIGPDQYREIPSHHPDVDLMLECREYMKVVYETLSQAFKTGDYVPCMEKWEACIRKMSSGNFKLRHSLVRMIDLVDDAVISTKEWIKAYKILIEQETQKIKERFAKEKEEFNNASQKRQETRNSAFKAEILSTLQSFGFKAIDSPLPEVALTQTEEQFRQAVANAIQTQHQKTPDKQVQSGVADVLVDQIKLFKAETAKEPKLDEIEKKEKGELLTKQRELTIALGRERHLIAERLKENLMSCIYPDHQPKHLTDLEMAAIKVDEIADRGGCSFRGSARRYRQVMLGLDTNGKKPKKDSGDETEHMPAIGDALGLKEILAVPFGGDQIIINIISHYFMASTAVLSNTTRDPSGFAWRAPVYRLNGEIFDVRSGLYRANRDPAHPGTLLDNNAKSGNVDPIPVYELCGDDMQSYENRCLAVPELRGLTKDQLERLDRQQLFAAMKAASKRLNHDLFQEPENIKTIAKSNMSVDPDRGDCKVVDRSSKN